MIPRYEVPQIADAWSDRARMANWLEIELLAVEAWSELGVIPEADAGACRESRHRLECANEFRTAIRIAGIVERIHTDEHVVCTERLGPRQR